MRCENKHCCLTAEPHSRKCIKCKEHAEDNPTGDAEISLPQQANADTHEYPSVFNKHHRPVSRAD
jgi:hypothetical protein